MPEPVGFQRSVGPSGGEVARPLLADGRAAHLERAAGEDRVLGDPGEEGRVVARSDGCVPGGVDGQQLRGGGGRRGGRRRRESSSWGAWVRGGSRTTAVRTSSPKVRRRLAEAVHELVSNNTSAALFLAGLLMNGCGGSGGGGESPAAGNATWDQATWRPGDLAVDRAP